MKKRVTAFAYAILRNMGIGTEILAVRRSPNDRYFPNMWGIPAGTLRKGEEPLGAIERTAKHRLEVEVEVLGERGTVVSDRGTHLIEMRLYETRIVAGSPLIREVDLTGYGYTEVQWVDPSILHPANEQGSLCCRLVGEWLRTLPQ